MQYADKWDIYFNNKQSFLDSLTIEDWNLAFDAVSEDKACVFYPDGDCIVIRNDTNIFAK